MTSPGTDETRSIGEILSDVSTDLSTLVRQELELAKAELKQSATRAGAGAGMFGGAAVAGHMVLLFVSIAAWWALGNAIGRGWSALIVALIWALIAVGLALGGRGQLARVRGLPRTADTVQKIPDALKGNEPRDGYGPAPSDPNPVAHGRYENAAPGVHPAAAPSPIFPGTPNRETY